MKTMKMILLLCIISASTSIFAQTSRGEVADTTQKADPGMETEEEVFMVVEEMPEFPGGEAAMFKFIADNLEYPAEARENNIQGRVTVQFVIDEKGNITDAKVLSSPSSLLSAAALDVVNSMPQWKPGKQKGKEVSVRYLIPIRFVLGDDSKPKKRKRRK